MRGSRRAPLEALQPYLLDVPHPGFVPPDAPMLAPQPPLDFRQLFGNELPVEIEIGFGKGLFLCQQGLARPDTNFLGIEIERKYTLLTATRISKLHLTNVKLACTDARWFLKERVADNCVAALHAYFPDPWWKNRHKKRKLFTLEFARQCARTLRTGGRLHFVTDVANYFAESIAMLQGVVELKVMPVAETGDREFLTNFERKYRLEGRPIHRAVYEKSESV